ncbi:hypothetical protein AVEN_218098-1 [Araneus ventricosus]|uniref:Uncharacterized protein n=1 Tax=Araneus ventricosus TaxID=182803 RepID=A0A4Y2RFN4_ARAVE|nr:hypothetical protein AVEN_82700-1 [Araneus ventricosus]GBN74614.1 hypothetical protein AVEN_218098-1 [Araneus ventricosus]
MTRRDVMLMKTFIVITISDDQELSVIKDRSYVHGRINEYFTRIYIIFSIKSRRRCLGSLRGCRGGGRSRPFRGTPRSSGCLRRNSLWGRWEAAWQEEVEEKRKNID